MAGAGGLLSHQHREQYPLTIILEQVKKPSQPRDTRDTRDTRPAVKTWSRETLRREDYCFGLPDDFPPDLLKKAWLWELDRELGSGNLPFFTAWKLHEIEGEAARLKAHYDGTHPLSDSELAALLREPPPKSAPELRADLEKLRAHIRAFDGEAGGKLLSDEELETVSPSWKPAIPKEPMPMLKSYYFDEVWEHLTPETNFLETGLYNYTTIQPIEIDWTLSETDLKEMFVNWLRHGPHPFNPSQTGEKKKTRKTKGILAWLEDLAIYRIGEAKFTRLEGLKMLADQSAISAPNWEKAQRLTRERIEMRKTDLQSSALNMSRNDPRHSSPDWRDYFARL